DENGLSDESLEDLAGHLGIGSRQLRRLFLKHLGATPVAVVQTRRLHFAKTLIDQTDLPFTQAALASGFNSIRRFNASFRTLYGRTPTELRGLARRHGASQPEHYRFRLPFRPPFDWDGLLGFLAPRAIPGVEEVTAEGYRRTIVLLGKRGRIAVRLDGRGDAIGLPAARAETIRRLAQAVERGELPFTGVAGPAPWMERFRALPGIGEWTAQYVAMRALGEPDAFPAADLGLLRASGAASPKQL